MPLKITESITRDCCDPRKDLKSYRGIKAHDNFKYDFCVHCGQVWEHSSEMGPAGSYDPVLVKVKIG